MRSPVRDPLAIRQLLAEHARRSDARRSIAESITDAPDPRAQAERLLSEHHPKQAACVNDQSSLVAVLGTRRSGKSRGWLRKLVHDAISIPGSYQVYTNTTWNECRRIAWRGARPCDGLLGLNDNFQLGATFTKSERSMLFPNQSIIECIPADDVPAIERALGMAPHRVWFDEAQKFPHLDYALKEILGPAMADFDGQIVLTGTPSRDCVGLFYDVTKDGANVGGWAVHKLNVLDNPWFGQTTKERYARTVLKHLIKFALDEDDPQVRRMWFGQWIEEDASFVYHVHRVPEEDLLYAPARWYKNKKPNHEWLGGEPNIRAALKDLPLKPDGSAYEWIFGMGTDLGYDPDPFAYVVWAWTWGRPELFELLSWKQTKLIPDKQAQIIQDLLSKLELAFAGADAGGGGKGIVKGWAEGWQDRYPIPIEEAPKAQKVTAIEFLNNDLRRGTLKLREGGPLYEEMRKLAWAPRKGQGRQLELVQRGRHGRKKFPNDCCDAGLYGHRMAQHHRYVEPETEPAYDTPEYWEKEAKRDEDEVLDDLEQEREEEQGYGVWH